MAGREDWMLDGRLAARRLADERRREGNHVWANEGGRASDEIGVSVPPSWGFERQESEQ